MIVKAIIFPSSATSPSLYLDTYMYFRQHDVNGWLEKQKQRRRRAGMNAPTNHRHHCAALVRAAAAVLACWRSDGGGVCCCLGKAAHASCQRAAPRHMACPAWSASLPACLAALAAFLMLPALQRGPPCQRLASSSVGLPASRAWRMLFLSRVAVQCYCWQRYREYLQKIALFITQQNVSTHVF